VTPLPRLLALLEVLVHVAVIALTLGQIGHSTPDTPNFATQVHQVILWQKHLVVLYPIREHALRNRPMQHRILEVAARAEVHTI